MINEKEQHRQEFDFASVEEMLERQGLALVAKADEADEPDVSHERRSLLDRWHQTICGE